MPTQAIAEPYPEQPVFDLPEVEVLCGVEVPKVSPKTRHSVLQFAVAELLDAWGGARGFVGTEWRFWLARGPEGSETTLVPDVAYVEDERLNALSDEDAQEPPFAPTIAAEIRSPSDRERNVRKKAGLYLEYGAQLVLDVDPERRRIVAFDRKGERTFTEDAPFEHEAAPGLSFDLGELFARGDRRRK